MPCGRGFDALRQAADAPLRGRASAARARLREEAIALARRDRLVDAAWTYRIAELDAPAGEVLHVGNEVLIAPRLLPESGELTAVACGVCTVGPTLEQRVRALFAERRASLAVALDELGNEVLSAVSRHLQDRILADVTRRGWTMAGELRAGDPGLELSAQAAVARLADANSIGAIVTSGGLLDPLKSMSMVLGVGTDLPVARWSRCDPCPSRERCRTGGQRTNAMTV